jgi:hypothetical protein
MKLIAEKRSSSDRYDVLRMVRNNGSCTETLMPRQDVLPHDLLHYVVESALPLRQGFLSQLALGHEAEPLTRAVHDPANRALAPEAAQAEAIVEQLQQQLSAGRFDLDAFLDAAARACAVRAQPPFDFSAYDVRSCLYERALALHRQWSTAPWFSTLSLEFSPRLL